MDNVLTAEEAAKILRIDVEDIEKKRKRGKISYIRLKKGVFGYAESAIADYLTVNTTKRKQCAENHILPQSEIKTEISNPPPGISSGGATSKSETDASLRGTELARKIAKRTPPLPLSPLNRTNQQQENRIN